MKLDRHCARVALLFAFCCLVTPAFGANPAATGSGPPARVMTMNMDQGIDLNGLVAAQTPQDLATAVTAAFQAILDTNPSERAAALAREIAETEPDLVGLQEAVLVRTSPSSPPRPASTVEVDLLQLLLDELAKLGLTYEAVAIVPGIDAQAPSTLGEDVRLTDRTVIIAHTDNQALRLSHLQVQEFLVNLVVPIAIPPGSLTVTRGWASIDATLHGRTFRFITTHLEVTPETVQLAQAVELLASATNTDLSVIMAADFNARADNPADPSFTTYAALLNAGFTDAWTQTHPKDSGFTCCQAPDLMNAVSTLDQRIDLVLYRGSLHAEDASLLGNSPADKTPSGLWPSDHAALEVDFSLGGSMQVVQH